MQVSAQPKPEPKVLGFLVKYEEMVDGGWREAPVMLVFKDAPIRSLFPHDAAIRHVQVKKEYSSVH